MVVNFVYFRILTFNILIASIIIITMARQPHMGLLFSEVTWSAHLWQFGDQPTGRAVQLNPDVTARAIWQSGNLGEKWPLEFRLQALLVLFMP
jgi:hypothetical protein